MNIRARLVLLAVLVAVVTLGAGSLALYAVTTVTRTYEAEARYAEMRREVTRLRDGIFDYLAVHKAAGTVPIVDQAAYLEARLAKQTRDLTDPVEKASAGRMESSLAAVEHTARELGAPAGSQPGSAASRAELTERLYSGATDITAELETMQSYASERTLAQLSWIRTVGAVAGVLGFLIVLALVASVAARIVRGLSDLNRGLQRFARGELDTRLVVHGHDELSQAAAGFDSMAEAVQRHNRKLDELNTRLVEVNERLITADRAKSAFIANMNHDLRTPLNSIIGFSGVLLAGLPGPLNDEQSRQLGFINRSGTHLNIMVSDMLEMARLDSVGLPLRSGRFPLEGLVQDVAEMFRLLAEAKGVELIAVAEPFGAEVVADQTACMRVLTNLVGNALKFTDIGSVTFRAQRRLDDLVFEVRDTGRGIAQADRRRVFEPFEQVADKAGQQTGGEGIGLGLAIVSKIVTGLGGTITLDSQAGVGSTFTVRLPVEPA